MSHAVAASLLVLTLTWLSEHALGLFFDLQRKWFWLPLLWTPAITVLVVWLTRRLAMGAAGSGIPQVMAAQDPRTPPHQVGLFVSVKLSLAKVLLTAGGLLAGLSTGREGPSVQIAAGVMHHARRWLPQRSGIPERGLLVAGGAAGIAAAFNTPLGGVMFAIEELSRRPEERASGLLIAAIVVSGLVAVSMHGNAAYFGTIMSSPLGWRDIWSVALMAVACGLLGGLFSRLMLDALSAGPRWLRRWRTQHPLMLAGVCGLAVAVIGLATAGATFGSGYAHTKSLLEGQNATHGLHTLMRFMATWLSSISGVPGGIFASSLAIGASVGHDIAQWTGQHQPTLIALGMAGFLAGVTQAPLTAFIIVMEMVTGHEMVLSLMACAMGANMVSRLVSPSLYGSLALMQLSRLPASTPHEAAPSSTANKP
ncbi:MAG: hypothetical protein RI907_1094 [Pseudomonadota bacterium]